MLKRTVLLAEEIDRIADLTLGREKPEGGLAAEDEFEPIEFFLGHDQETLELVCTVSR